ncbi:protein phosphatase 2C domain-containing protein [Candidatus Woesearchaeota archaeon]|nr:protein phosphatase 2C domain-containing protein [Candidatus Woesearchaeota archaeon]MBL7051000.1 protein phosphatase 2C domain-containing protein [Candidatus Woesearchaeota archaeon]
MEEEQPLLDSEKQSQEDQNLEKGLEKLMKEFEVDKNSLISSTGITDDTIEKRNGTYTIDKKGSLPGGNCFVKENGFVTNPIKSIYAVTDGMGGANHKSGDVASELVCNGLNYKLGLLKDDLSDSKEIDILQNMEDTIYALNGTVSLASGYSRFKKIDEELKTIIDRQKIDENGKKLINLARKKIDDSGILSMDILDKMGCTLDVCFLHKNMVYGGHVGNGRVYKIGANGTIDKMTNEHVAWNPMIDRSKLSRLEEAVEEKIYNAGLTSYMGIGKDIQIDMYEFPLEKGDSFLICSDSLSHTVSEEEIVHAFGDISKTKQRLWNLVVEPEWFAEEYAIRKGIGKEEAVNYLRGNDPSFIILKRR